MSDRVEYACDRCDTSAWFMPSEKLTIGVGCVCGGAWIMLDAQGPMLGEPICDFPTLGIAR